MPDLVHAIPPFVPIALVSIGVVLGTVAYLILLERKIASWVQDRLGPNRAGPWGLLQPMADGLKMFFKEDYRPAGTDKVLFTVAPALMMLVVLVALAAIPWAGVKQATRTVTVPAGGNPALIAQDLAPINATFVAHSVNGDQLVVTYHWPFQIAKLNIGVLFIIAVLSLAVYGVVIGGWASNNKYSLLGGLRAAAQMISYEIPLGLSLLTVVLMYGTLELGEIVEKQAHLWAGFIPAWTVFAQPLGFVFFLICLHAEANRAPFDLAEAEQELVGGYHTEFASMRLGLLLLAEYASMIVTSSVCVALFFGGWHLPGLTGPNPAYPAITDSFVIIALRCIVFFTKVLLIISVFMWVRWSLPRFRFDQLMMLAWRALIPITLGILVATCLVIYFAGWNNSVFRDFRRIDGVMALLLAASNAGVLAAAMLISRVLPPPPETNRRLPVAGSRFTHTALPMGVRS